MKRLFLAGFLLLDLMLAVVGDAAYAAERSGAETAAALRSRYYDTRQNCGKASIPAFVCTGVIFRATIPSPAYKSWAPSPKAVASGGFSFSFLRVDSKYKKLVRQENNGLIVYPPASTPDGKSKVNVLCAFPVDGATDTRSDQGCGRSSKETSNSSICHAQGIYTAEQWFAKHTADRLNNLNQCGFNVRDDANEKATNSFNEFIRAMKFDKAESFEQQNELRLSIWDVRSNLPIEAFFYLPGGLADAQYDQKDYYQSTGLIVPVIAMTLPSVASQDAIFNFNNSDQVVRGGGQASAEYIESAIWIKRYDPGKRKDEWTLSVTPTEKGRTAKAELTDVVYAELLRKYGSDPRWKGNDGGGMRRQLACHYDISRNKPVWNMEPFRPNVPHDVAVAQGCNPV